ncbi:MAG: DUF1289 domain-containing protein [Parashewanella sp.]
MNSPCVARCGLNDDDYCMGCFRHLDEIVAWSKLDDNAKFAIVAKLSTRKQNFVDDKNTQSITKDKWLQSQNSKKHIIV